MAGRVGDFEKQIRNQRNSNDKFDIQVDHNIGSKKKRISAGLLQNAIARGLGTKKDFTTITPQGLPPDLVGDSDNAIERQNVLTEPKGHKNEAARLPPFKPFKTISDEDNLHLLPGETGERARLNLLDTKAVAAKDVEDIKKAYYLQRELYPELYSKQKAPVEEKVAPKPKPVEEKKTGFFSKLFGKKKEPELPKPPPPPPKPPVPPPEEVKPKPPPPPEAAKPKPPPKPKPKSEAKTKSTARRRKPSISSESSSESSRSSSSGSESSSSYEEMGQWGGHPAYPTMGGYPSQHPSQYPFQYPGFPGGYSPYFNQPYANGFGPMQLPPNYNPCMEEVQLARCKQLKKCQGEGDGTGRHNKVKKKPQGLNFDFLPHDDLATEVTMTIEPDEPEPLQYAVENGIMPIICCYMPSSIAVQPQQAAQESLFSQYGYPSSYAGYSSGGTSTQKSSSGHTKSTSKSKTTALLATTEQSSLPPLFSQSRPSYANEDDDYDDNPFKSDVEDDELPDVLDEI